MAGLSTPDDAAVWKLDEERALVVTTDFFTPVVDDPYDFGAISAANSLSDIYAMGGEPFMALNISAFPPQLPPEIISDILRGGAEKAKEAGVVIAGGHTVQDKEPKFGLAALGFVPVNRVLTKGGMHPGDILYLSKPIGSGVIASAIKTERLDPKEVNEVIDWMKLLNRNAARLAIQYGSGSATDITGFSLLGHAREMCLASGFGLRLNYDSIPFYNHVEELAAQWCFPGGSFDNAEYFGDSVKFSPKITQEQQMLLFDPQTSGGLIFSVSPDRAGLCEEEAISCKIPIWNIGEVTSEQYVVIS